MDSAPSQRLFRTAYAAHREAEGRTLSRGDFLLLPYLVSGPQARQWAVRARTFDAFMTLLLRPRLAERRALRVLDVGAGNGWLSRRMALAGAFVVATDFRDDVVDGLGVASVLAPEAVRLFHRVVASFDTLPLASAQFDVVVFNASLHYAPDLGAALHEAHRMLRHGGQIVILDSPFYRRTSDGELMVAEKRREGWTRFGDNAAVLLSFPIVEYLTPDRLSAASRGLALHWRRHRVRYPLWYEMRALVARMRRRRVPSRFDLWEAVVEPW